MKKCKTVVKDPRDGKTPFKKWTNDQKIFFLHELLDHFNRGEPGASMALNMLAKIKYDPMTDRNSHGMIPKYPKITREEMDKLLKEEKTKP